MRGARVRGDYEACRTECKFFIFGVTGWHQSSKMKGATSWAGFTVLLRGFKGRRRLAVRGIVCGLPMRRNGHCLGTLNRTRQPVGRDSPAGDTEFDGQAILVSGGIG